MKTTFSSSFTNPSFSSSVIGVDRFRLLWKGWSVKVMSLLLVVMVGGGVVGQATNPTAYDLSSGSFSFTTQTSTNTTYPANMQGWTTGASNITAITTAVPSANQTLVASGSASTSGLSNLGSNGFNFLPTGSSPNTQVGSIVVALKSTGRNSLLVSWTAADNLASASRVGALALQYRVGTTGTFTTVANTTYTSTAAAQAAAIDFSNIALPAACENVAVLQIRWIYWEVSGSGGRDPIRLDDITVSSTSSSVSCSGTPAPGNTLSSVTTPIVAGSSTTLSLQTATTGSGVTYQWQSSVDNSNWTNISTAGTSSTYSATPSTSTYYRCGVTCSSSTGYSTSKLVDLTYCASTGPSTQGTDYFTNFSTTGGSTNIGNTTSYSTNGYGNFTSQTVTQNQGGTINYSAISPGIGDGSTFYIFVDWNEDGDFSDSGEEVVASGVGSGNQIFSNPSGSFIVPSAATLGSKRMRIIIKDASAAITSCNTALADSETEDYTLTVSAASTAPSINTSGTLVALSTTYGTASSNSSFTISGSNLDGTAVTATPPAGFEISTSSSFTSVGTNASPVSLGSNTSISSTIYVRLAASATYGSYSGNIVISGGGLSSAVNVATTSSSVSKKALTITGLTASNKVYDGGTSVTINGSPAYSGLVNGESFSVVGTPSWVFGTKTVGTNKSINQSGSYDSPSSNYTVTQPTLTANITAISLSVSNATVSLKTYDGTSTATLSGSLSGVISPDVVTLNGTGTYASVNVGTGISVTSTSTLSGADAGNYTLIQPTGLIGEITKANQTITFASTANATTTTADYAPGATSASSGTNAITYASNNATVATIVSNQIHIVGVGTATITASQSGSANYNAAADVNQTLTVTVNTDVFRSYTSGNWNTAGTWQSASTTAGPWATATATPGANNSVYILSSHTVTLTQSESCKDLHINTSGIVGIGTNILSVNGKIRAFTGTVTGTSSTAPVSAMISTSGGGVLKFVGLTRNITNLGEWGATTTGNATEFALNEGETGTLGTSYKSSSISITSGTIDVGTNRLAPDNGTSGQGDLTISSGATLVSSGTGSSSPVISRTGTSTTGRSGIFTLNGTLTLLGAAPQIEFTTVNLNGTVNYGASSIQNLLISSFNGAASPNTYTNLKLSGTSAKSLGVNTTVNGTLTITGTASLALNAKTLTYGSSSTLEYSSDSQNYSIGLEWPSSNGPSNVTVNLSGIGSPSLTLSGDRTVSGSLNLTAGKLDIAANTLTLTGSANRTNGNIDADAGTLSFANTNNLSLPTSLFSGNIYNLSKASGAGTVTLNDDLTVTNELTSAASTGAFIIASSKALTVNGTGKATIDGVITNNGTFTLNSGATLVQGSGNAISGGTYNVKQNITGAGSGTPTGRYWYVGSPVSGATSAVYDAAGANMLKYYSEPANAWQEITDNTSALEVGRGYFVQAASGTSELNFTGGTINNDSYTLNVTRNTSTNAYRGYNLLTNPYPSYLNWDNVTRSNVGSTIWYRTWNSNSNTMVFDTYNDPAGFGTNNNQAGAVSNWIPPMQSFWVSVPQGQTSGTVSFGNAQRSHYSIGVQGLRSSAQDFPAFLRLNLLDGNFVDQTILYMKPDANNTFDEYDSEKMFLGGVPQFYSTVNAKKLVLNGMKNQKARTSVPLTMELPTSKSYTFQAEEFNIEDGLILLEDKQEGVIQDLTINPTYSFFGNAGTNATRFVVHFQLANAPILVGGPQELESLGSDELMSENIQIVSNNQGTVIIRLDEGFKPEGSIRIFDASGRLVEQTDFNDQETTIQLNEQAGMYFVEVAAGKLMVKKKIVIE